jgi:hypothetical protein
VRGFITALDRRQETFAVDREPIQSGRDRRENKENKTGNHRTMNDEG